MQKKIIALAIAGLSSAAFAQSNVTISGLFDAGLLNSKTQVATSSNNVAYNNTATSAIAIAATEDLGGGMKSGVFLESDIRGNNQATASSFGSFQHYVWIGNDKSWGTVSFGQRTNLMTTTLTTVQPYGTAMGGGFGGASAVITSNRLRGGGSDATGAFAATTRDVRPDGVIDYRSPSFSGFSFGAQYRPKNSDTTETTASYGYLNLGLNYNNGPLNLSFADTSYTNTGAVAGGHRVSGLDPFEGRRSRRDDCRLPQLEHRTEVRRDSRTVADGQRAARRRQVGRQRRSYPERHRRRLLAEQAYRRLCPHHQRRCGQVHRRGW